MLRVFVWGGILILLVLAAGFVPKQEHGLQLFIAGCLLLWLLGSALWIVRSIFRFVVR